MRIKRQPMPDQASGVHPKPAAQVVVFLNAGAPHIGVELCGWRHPGRHLLSVVAHKHLRPNRHQMNMWAIRVGGRTGASALPHSGCMTSDHALAL